jgi:hypothetical protein
LLPKLLQIRLLLTFKMVKIGGQLIGRMPFDRQKMQFDLHGVAIWSAQSN